MHQKGIAPVYLILIAAALFFGGVLYYKSAPQKASQSVKISDPSRPTPYPSPWDKVEDLKNGNVRYTNYKDNFQVDLPKSWTINYTNRGMFSLFASNNTNKAEGGPDWTTGLDIRVSVQKPTEDTIKNAEDSLKGDERLMIDGFTAARRVIYLPPFTEPYYAVKYFIKKERKLYYIVEFGTGEKATFQNNQNLIKRIINTFQFLDKSDRKISLIHHSNSDLGYSFDYPSNWLVNTFQNNGDYNKGITVVNDDDKEMLTLQPEPGNGAPCPPASYYGKDYQYPKTDVQLGSETVHLVSDCNNPRVKTSKGYELKMDADVFGVKTDPRLLELLKSFQGLKIVK